MSRSRRPRRDGGCNCFLCDTGWVRGAREKVYARQDEAEAQDFARMSPDERAWQAGTYTFDPEFEAETRAIQRFFDTAECGDIPLDRDSPLTAPLGKIAHWSNRRCQWWKLARLIQAALLACALASCGPSYYPGDSAWLPGDPPLLVWAESDALWDHVAVACAAWGARTGLECQRTDDSTARVRVVARELDDDHLAGRAWDTGLVELDPGLVGHHAGNGVMSHELGHLLGVWDHVPDDVAPWALMADRWAGDRDPAPSDADWAALAEAWGEEL